MALHSPCEFAKQKMCHHESNTVTGTCGYHHCRLDQDTIDRLTGRINKLAEDRYYEYMHENWDKLL